jgi:hypothetical protein
MVAIFFLLEIRTFQYIQVGLDDDQSDSQRVELDMFF